MAMKKFSSTLLTLVVLGAGILLFSSCDKKSNAPGSNDSGKPSVSAEKNSFKEVTSQLDAGGDFYLYLGTEQVLSGLSGKISGWRELVGSLPDTREDREQVSHVFDVITHLISESGIEDVSGLGVSSIARENGLYRTKTFLHHYPGKGAGFGWTLFGQKPHELTSLNFLPANTALAMFSDTDVPLLWSVIEKECERSGIPQVDEHLKTFVLNFERGTGLKWNDVLASLGGEYGIVMTLDDTKMISVPMAGHPLQIPEPGLMLVAKVKNDIIFDRIDKAMQQAGQTVIRVDKGDLKMRTMPVPLPLPIQFRPTVATSDGYLFISTSDSVIQEAIAVKGGQKPGLKSTEEFKRLSAGIPTQGNQLYYMSRRFGETMIEIQRQTLAMNSGAEPKVRQLFETFLRPGKATFAYSVTANTDEGLLSVGNGNQQPAKTILAMGIALPAGLLSAIAIPNFVKARQTAQHNACVNNLRQIDGAKQQWALENNKKATDTPTQANIQVYVGHGPNGSWPVCPQGGHYTIGPVEEVPQCSIPGHSLPN
jgi:hypothetical protein